MRICLRCALVVLCAMFFASYADAADGKQICDEVYRILQDKEPDTGERTPEISRARATKGAQRMQQCKAFLRGLSLAEFRDFIEAENALNGHESAEGRGSASAFFARCYTEGPAKDMPMTELIAEATSPGQPIYWAWGLMDVSRRHRVSLGATDIEHFREELPLWERGMLDAALDPRVRSNCARKMRWVIIYIVELTAKPFGDNAAEVATAIRREDLPAIDALLGKGKREGEIDAALATVSRMRQSIAKAAHSLPDGSDESKYMKDILAKFAPE